MIGLAIVPWIILLIIKLCKKCQEEREIHQAPVHYVDPRPIEPSQEVIVEPLPIRPRRQLKPLKRTSVWKSMLNYSAHKTNCSICLFPETHFKSICGHAFHIPCIV